MADAVVLLVDDEKVVLDALRAQVRQAFHPSVAVESAESADEALGLLGELVADGCNVVLVVTDWWMPGTRGDALLEEVKRRHPHIHRVMLTGQADPVAMRRVADAALAHRVLSKPWTSGDLESTIRTALAR